jgi:tRNA A-37 threonylcarbamoyl transferase component Bud32
MLGDFSIERELGRGGMGVVWLATQKSLGRRVALKTLPDFASMDPAAVLRFRREAEATSRIAHPGIVPVYGTGFADGIHWYAMEFVDGPTLATWLDRLASRQVERLEASLVDEVEEGQRYASLREQRSSGQGNRYVRSCARLCADVASALAAAHRAGVVHRDVKPGNVMIHPDGRPVVVDFGLARDERSAQLTRSGEQIGTPSYMAPEQARGSRAIDARADVYSLGAVLYELLALQPPFTGSSAAEIAARILADDAVDVRRRNPNVPVALAAIVHRCLQKATDDRYPAMESLEADLRAFLAGDRVAAKLPSVFARAQHGVLRRKNAVLASIGASCAAIAIAVFAGVVDDRGDVRDGEQAMLDARMALVDRGDADRARDLYERAAALTKQPERVRAQRRSDFEAAFESLYAKDGGLLALKRFSQVFDDDERASLKPALDRLEGRGSLRIATRAEEMRTASIEVREVRDGELDAEWRSVAAGEPLPIGELLVRTTRDDGAVSVMRAEVRVDETVKVAPQPFLVSDVPSGFVGSVDSDLGSASLVAECETTRGEWRSWLETMPSELREEMTPAVWSDDASLDHLPVRGLSFHQARAFANRQRAHLPTMREHWVAASGGLVSLAWPWGGKADAARVVADPFTRSEAMAAASMDEGRSPFLVRHVLGNVAEALSADGLALHAGGGSFADDARALAMDGSKRETLRTPLLSVFAPSPAVGTRLHRFVPNDEAGSHAARTRALREELERSPRGCAVQEWTLDAEGSLSCEMVLVGVHDGRSRERQLQFDTRGFAQVADSLRAVDGHGKSIPSIAAEARGAEVSTVRAELPSNLRAGQSYRWRVRADLQPASGLLPQRDAFVLRLPMARGLEVAQMHSLTLPAGCRIESVSPEAETWTDRNATHVLWSQTADARIETAVVRFRRDGGLGAALPLRADAERRCEQLLSAWSARSAALESMLDDDFVHAPFGMDRRAALARDIEAADRSDSMTFVQLDDVARIGAVESCELRVDWTLRGADGRSIVWKSAPFLAQWRERAGQLRALRLQPYPQPDQGRYDSGGYRNDALRVGLAKVDGSTIVRTQEELCPLQAQVTCDGATARLTGLLAAPGEDDEVLRARLCGAVQSGSRAVRTSVASASDGAVEEWERALADGVSCERWRFVQRGSRRLLLRFCFEAADGPTARARMADAAMQRWMRDVESALRID